MAKSNALKKDQTRRHREGAQSNLRAVRKSGSSDADDKTTTSTPAALERLIHERLRLGIVSALAVNEKLTFNDLKQTLKTTDGNLSVHARKLEEAAYIACEKYFDGRTPKTVYRLTVTGRHALERYLSHMESIIHATRKG